jgi:hypothetical protein
VIAGHFGFAAGVKSRATKTPLWKLMLACQWLDVIFALLFAFGIEGLEPIEPGKYGSVIIHADWTHSLIGALLLSALLGVLLRDLAVLAVSFSHWILDLVVHRADMPLVPHGSLRLGLGLWRWPIAAGALELLLVVAGAALYWRAALATGASREANRAAAAVLASGLLTLALNLAGL